MTVVSVGDTIRHHYNDIKYAILNNDPIESHLHVIVVISNPCLYASRYVLLKEFIHRIEKEESNVILYIVELIYPGQKYTITSFNHKNHLQLYCETPLWHKENMINIGVRRLLPSNWSAFAWIDADIEFESATWVTDTLKILNGSRDIIQLFSHSIDMDFSKRNLNIFNSFGYSFCKEKNYTTRGLDYWHPGYAWAITRKAYESIGGLYDLGILGSGDNIMAMSLIHKVEKMTNPKYSSEYNKSMFDFQQKASKLRLGYTPGVIRHHYHGSKQNRQYTERWKILIQHNYNPQIHVKYSIEGVLTPSNVFSAEFKKSIFKYFTQRKEDS